MHGRFFRVAESGFWQVHVAAAETLQSAVAHALRADLVDPDVEHVDLYGGVGLLAVPILEAVGERGKIVSVESSAGATELAQENLADWIGSQAVTERLEHYLRSKTIRPGATVVLDPPRSGAGREFAERLAATSAAQIVHVAFDPGDLGTFRSFGW